MQVVPLMKPLSDPPSPGALIRAFHRSRGELKARVTVVVEIVGISITWYDETTGEAQDMRDIRGWMPVVLLPAGSP